MEESHDESVDVGDDDISESSELSVTESPTCNATTSTTKPIAIATSPSKRNATLTTAKKRKKTASGGGGGTPTKSVKSNQKRKKANVVGRGKKPIVQERRTITAKETNTSTWNGSSSGGGGGLEASVEQVAERFAQGCECRGGGGGGDGESISSCFSNINPESAYKHRLNIAELTRSEHDMYLMGVTMASLSNPDETARHTERKRLRTQYVFQGKKICLDAFLYLENCTQYQLKRIRKHIMTHGVTPRVHGNHGKRPHNRFSLDIYQQATAFLQSYIQRIQQQQPLADAVNLNSKDKNGSCYLPADVTCKTVHAAYKEYMEHFEPGTKWLGYSTFRQFLKRQFPLVKFTPTAPLVPTAVATVSSPSNASASVRPLIQIQGSSSLADSPPVVTTDNDE